MLAQRAIVHYFCVCESAHIKLSARARTQLYHILPHFQVFVKGFLCLLVRERVTCQSLILLGLWGVLWGLLACWTHESDPAKR